MTNLALLEERVGRRLTGIRRVRYIHDSAVLSDRGILELRFEDDEPVLLDAGADGEELDVRRGPWVDPFAEPLLEVNREFIERSGKWTAFVIDQGDELGLIIGRALDHVEAQSNSLGKVCGARFDFGTSTLVARVGADELLVSLK